MVMNEGDPHRPARANPVYLRRKLRPLAPVSWFIGFLGFICLVFLWPLGVGLVVLALIIDQPRWLCGGCGNRVEKTTVMCPHCHGQLRGKLPEEEAPPKDHHRPTEQSW